MKLDEIRIRDPFILCDGGKYYLYGTTRLEEEGGEPVPMGFDVYESSDLENFSGPYPVFEPEEGFFGIKDFWAPEVHYYRGEYYMFATFKGKSGLHGVGILKADNPNGPFTPHSEMPITPPDMAALDGTLYIEDGVPYMVFCHEWSQIIDGAMCYARLSDDLTRLVGEPVTMFTASANPFGRPSKMRSGADGYITDGPFMHRTKGGELLMLWSMRGERGYMECVYRSDNGKLDGSFSPVSVLYPDDGGHGMTFTDNGGASKFILHTPNTRGLERARIYCIEETDGTVNLKMR